MTCNYSLAATESQSSLFSVWQSTVACESNMYDKDISTETQGVMWEGDKCRVRILPLPVPRPSYLLDSAVGTDQSGRRRGQAAN